MIKAVASSSIKETEKARRLGGGYPTEMKFVGFGLKPGLAWLAWLAFPFGFGAKKDRGRGLSVLTAREMRREPKNLLVPFFARSLTLVPRSLLLNRTETLVTQAKHGRGMILHFIFRKRMDGKVIRVCEKKP